MKTSLKRFGLFMVLTGVLAAAWFAPSAADDSVALSPRAARQEAKRAAAPQAKSPSDQGKDASVRVLAIKSREASWMADASSEGLFGAASWRQPKTSPVIPVSTVVEAPPAVAPAQPPALPFTVLGKYQDAGDSIVFLRQGDNNLVVRVGDLIAENYKVEALEGSTLLLRYLPMDTVQRLDVGAAP